MQTSHKQSLQNFIDTVLNEQQRSAVLHQNGAVFVIAGAGSGKTRVITTRITHLLLTHAVNADHIIALTFTNKAAQEMKGRIAHFLPSGSKLPFVGTFHAYCLRILKQYSSYLPHPFKGILDTDDQQKIIKTIINKNGLQKELSAKQVAYQITQVKNHHFDHKNAFEKIQDQRIYEIYRAYEYEKQLSQCFDFDDLLIETLKLFNNTHFATTFHTQIRHILVDEYQDTNTIQHMLLKALSLEKGNFIIDSLCAVGDEDQSIYAWRGATVTNIRNFTNDFPLTTIIKIEQNYRSVQPILDVANSIIEHNTARTAKRLWSSKRGNNRIHLLKFASEYQEAAALTQLLFFIKKRNKLASTALLYRTHAQSRALEEALIKESIPYRIVGGVQFYDRMEIKDLLAYLRLVVNPFDRASCRRILNVPARKLGIKFEELFFETWNQEPFSTFSEVAQKLCATMSGAHSRTNALALFVSIFDDLLPTLKSSLVLAKIIERTRYMQYIRDTYEADEARERIANIDELMNAFNHFEEHNPLTLTQVLEEITLMQDHLNKDNDDTDVILLMTLHASKGLEFDIVVLIGLEEGLLPTSRALETAEAIEEERRLLYVGITRACERLLLTHTRYRYTYGVITDQRPSRFLKEISTHLLPYQDVQHWKSYELQNFFLQWLGYDNTQNPFHSFTPPAGISSPSKV